MLYRLTSTSLRLFGKNYSPDPSIPALYQLQLYSRRLIWLVRGFIRLQTICFIGRTVCFEGKRNLDVGHGATFEDFCWINAVANQRVMMGKNVRIGAYTRIMCTAHLSRLGCFFRMGAGSACGEFCYFGAAGGIQIGQDTIMGQYVSFHAQNHVFSDATTPILSQGTTEKGIRVGDHCWIGAKATILDGTIIGDRCVVAAGAVVSGEFPAYSLIAGVPARVIRDLRVAT